ncbi:MAG: phenylacetate--CoA ligase [Lachnospiraceae bacterium]|jgi:phenylacetate-CoA ligase|nr:phenylacetate--CoA ligase [Lachnospiraceae bacterium]
MKLSALELLVREQEGTGRLTRREIEAIQLRKLNGLLRREKERGGFYGRLPEGLSSLSELSRLPFTTERDLRDLGNRMVLLSQSEIDRVRTEVTSGTMGPAKRVYYSAADNERTVSFFAAGLSELVGPGERTMICMPFSGPGGLGELIAKAICRLGAYPIPAGIRKTYGELLGILEKECPETFVGMPVPLLSLVRLMPETPLKRALISADACPETVKGEIETRLGSRLYPHYGSRETGLGGAVTCPAFWGMHLRENDIIAEIVDEEGKVLPRGEWGELVITTIQAEAMPLIRYRTGDRTRLLPERCPCGSELVRLDTVTRLKPGGVSMYELDDLTFQIPELIDYRAELVDGTLYLEGYVSRLEGNFPEELCGYPARWKLKMISMEDVPCYMAKRKIR